MADLPFTLDYANLNGAQPAWSEFAVEGLENGGVRLTKPLEAQRLMSAVLVLFATTMVGLSAVVVVSCARERSHINAVLTSVPILAILAALTGTLMWYARWLAHPRLLSITVCGGRLTLDNVAWTSARRPIALNSVRKFTVKTAGIDLVRRRRLGHLYVHRSYWRRQLLLQGETRDECLWIAGLLNAAIAAEKPVPMGPTAI